MNQKPTEIFSISALAPKMGQIIKIMAHSHDNLVECAKPEKIRTPPRPELSGFSKSWHEKPENFLIET